jgi:hypothetical protein
MAYKETNVDFNDAFKQLNEQQLGSTDLQLVLIQHDLDKDPYDTTLVIRSTSASGTAFNVVCCPRPCRIGLALNPANIESK